MLQLKTESVNKGYSTLLNELITKGELVSPRGMETWEMQDVYWQIDNPRKRSCEVIGRWKNLGFQLSECLWIMSGFNMLGMLQRYVPYYDRFSDDGKILAGAYGTRLRHWNGCLDQFICVYEKLLKDPNTRQALMMIWNPATDNKISRDIPCTNWMHFTIRDKKLNLKVQMRSNDALWGTPYNIFNFCAIQEMMAGWLNIEVGYYVHQVSCMHVYKDKIDIIKRMNYHIDSSPDIYDYVKPLDSRLPRVEFEETLRSLNSIDKMLSIIATTTLDESCRIAETLPSDYWKSYGWALIAYNLILRKREFDAINIINNIKNEFKLSLLQRLARFLFRQDIRPENYKPFSQYLKLPKEVYSWVMENPIEEFEAISR